MSVRTDLGDLYPFVGAAGLEDVVTILTRQEI